MHHILCNANVDLEHVLDDYSKIYNNINIDKPSCEACMQFPDPHFKKRHKKQRVLTNELTHALGKYMSANSAIFLQSDVLDVMKDTRHMLPNYNNSDSLAEEEDNDYLFKDIINDENYYNLDNLYDIPTEREINVLKRDLPVYRSIFRRK